MAKLKQVCNHPAQFLHDGSAIGHRSGKVARLLEILEEIHSAGEKVLCFTQYTEFAAMLQPLLTDTFGREVLYLHGGTPKKRRDEMVARFQGIANEIASRSRLSRRRSSAATRRSSCCRSRRVAPG